MTISRDTAKSLSNPAWGRLTPDTLRRWREQCELIARGGQTSGPWFRNMRFADPITGQLTDRGRRFLADGPCAINPQWPVGWDAWEQMVNERAAGRGRKKRLRDS